MTTMTANGQLLHLMLRAIFKGFFKSHRRCAFSGQSVRLRS